MMVSNTTKYYFDFFYFLWLAIPPSIILTSFISFVGRGSMWPWGLVLNFQLKEEKENQTIKTLYFAAKTFFTITKLTSNDAFVCRTPPIAITNLPISTYKNIYNYKWLKIIYNNELQLKPVLQLYRNLW